MILVGNEMFKLVKEDCMNIQMAKHVVTAESLPAAIKFAKRVAQTDKVIAFDGAYGAITCSEALADHLIKRAPIAHQRVEEELMPKWLRQRGFDPSEAL
jgi:4-aminobutyrate aminotransferase-like enzyme